MSTTIEDVMMDQYYEDLHNEYISALEDFASSKNLEELKFNLDKLNQTVKESDHVGSPELESTLQEIANLNLVYKEIIEAKESGKRQFIIGTILAVLGLLLSGVSFFYI